MISRRIWSALASLIIALLAVGLPPAGAATEPDAAGPCNAAWRLADIGTTPAWDDIQLIRTPYTAGGEVKLQMRDCGPDRDPEYRTYLRVYVPLRSGTDALGGVYSPNGQAFCRATAGQTSCTTAPIAGPATRTFAAVRQFAGNGVWNTYACGQVPVASNCPDRH